MSNRHNYYYKQLVAEDELDSGFTYAEDGDRNQFMDADFFGIFNGLGVTENGSPNLTVDVATGVAYDQQGLRVFVGTQQDLDCSVDYNSVSTAVVTPGNEKYLSIFLRFKRLLSDPRTDGYSQTVYFESAESFELWVKQGAEAVIPTATLPTLESDSILLADVRLINAQTQILNADIDMSRKQSQFILTGSPWFNSYSTVKAGLQGMMDGFNTIINGTQHLPASGIDYAGGGAWHDTTTNPATDVEAQLDKIISELAGETTGDDAKGGADLIGAVAKADSPDSLSAGSAGDQISALLSLVNARGRLAATNTWSHDNTFNGQSGDLNAALKTSVTATFAKLLWESATIGTRKSRIYGNADGFILTANAFWNSAAWERDEDELATMLIMDKDGYLWYYTSLGTTPDAIVWKAEQRLNAYTLEYSAKVDGTNTTMSVGYPTWEDVTGASIGPFAAKSGDILKVRYSCVVDIAGSTDNAEVQIVRDGIQVPGTHVKSYANGRPYSVACFGEYPYPSDDASVTVKAQGRPSGTTDTIYIQEDIFLGVELWRPGLP
jgi:regulation of enolase protein 1 (concanavalin A-like superfamily)